MLTLGMGIKACSLCFCNRINWSQRDNSVLINVEKFKNHVHAVEETSFLSRGVVFYSNNELYLTAVGRLIRSVHTVIVPVTHPHPWDTALGDRTLELVGGTCHFRCTRDRRILHWIQKNRYLITKSSNGMLKPCHWTLETATFITS